MDTRRPSNMFYRAKDGIYSTFLPRSSSNTLYDFVGAAIDWSENGQPTHYRILDTFLSDSMSDALLLRLARKLKERHGSLEILLTCPDSPFATARGQSIGQHPTAELKTGLKHLYMALHTHGLVDGPEGGSTLESLTSLAGLLTSEATNDRVKVKFYSVAPSAPMYFLGDLLVSSRFSYGKSSVDNPWLLIVDDGDRMNRDDVYSSYAAEFTAIWNDRTTTASPIAVPPLSFDLRGEKKERQIAVLSLEIVPFTDNTGLDWQLDAIHTLCEALANHPTMHASWPDDLISVHVGDGAALTFLNPHDAVAPLDLALHLASKARPHEFPQLRQGIAYGRAAVGWSSAATRTCIGQPMQVAARVMASCSPGEIRVTDSYYDAHMSHRHPWADLAGPPFEIPGSGRTEIRCRTIKAA